jgi:glycerophosphoryl diester phosphodiesterase
MVLKADGTPTSLVADAKAAGLAVHAWTLRPENDFLPPMLRTGEDPAGRGCGDVRLAGLLKAAGVAAVFSDAALKGRTCP